MDVEVSHFLFTFPRTRAGIVRKFPQGGREELTSPQVPLGSIWGQGMSSSPDLTQEIRLLPLLGSPRPLEGGAHPTGGAEHVECRAGVLKASRDTSQIQTALGLGPDVPGCSLPYTTLLAQPPPLLCPELSFLINLSSFSKYFISIY